MEAELPVSGSRIPRRKVTIIGVVGTVVWQATESMHTNGSLLKAYFFLKFYSVSFCMYECFACWSICVIYTCNAHGSQERAWDLMRLKLQVVSHHIGAGNRTCAYARGPSTLEIWTIFLAPNCSFLKRGRFHLEGLLDHEIWWTLTLMYCDDLKHREKFPWACAKWWPLKDPTGRRILDGKLNDRRP